MRPLISISNDLCWRAEEACLSAFPTPHQTVLDGWLVRAAGGLSRRTNSVNPMRGENHDCSNVIARCEAFYAVRGRPAIFRVPAIAKEMDAPLAALHYQAEAETRTLFTVLPTVYERNSGAIAITSKPSPEWIAAQARITGWDAAAMIVYTEILNTIKHEAAFISTRVQDEIVSQAYGVLVDGLLIVESVVTDSAHRQRGHATQTVAALLRWAHSRGAKSAALQVMVDNTSANHVYQRLGFTTELYRYHYRIKPM